MRADATQRRSQAALWLAGAGPIKCRYFADDSVGEDPRGAQGWLVRRAVKLAAAGRAGFFADSARAASARQS